jgi:hypothetical protein
MALAENCYSRISSTRLKLKKAGSKAYNYDEFLRNKYRTTSVNLKVFSFYPKILPNYFGCAQGQVENMELYLLLKF